MGKQNSIAVSQTDVAPTKRSGLSRQDAKAILHSVGLKSGMTAAAAEEFAADNIDALVAWTRQEDARRDLINASNALRKAQRLSGVRANKSAAPRQSVLVGLCILGALLTAAAGLLFMFWGYLR